MESGPAAFGYMSLRQFDALFEKWGARRLKPLNNKIVFVSYVAIGQGDVGRLSSGRTSR